MDLVRIGDKLISPSKIGGIIEDILSQREQGFSQAEVARRFGIDRSFVSRLETIGEVRKGKTIALLGFPVENVQELTAMAAEEGVEFVWLLTDKQRWQFVREKSGIELLDEVMSIIYDLRQFDIVIMLGSDERIRLARALLDREMVGQVLGRSPMTGDVHVDADELRDTIRILKKRDDFS